MDVGPEAKKGRMVSFAYEETNGRLCAASWPCLCGALRVLDGGPAFGNRMCLVCVCVLYSSEGQLRAFPMGQLRAWFKWLRVRMSSHGGA